MGGAYLTKYADSKEAAEKLLEQELDKARELGLEDIRARSIVQLDDGTWVAQAWVHS